MKDKNQKRINRRAKIRKRVSGNAEKPRLSVYRSANHVFAQLIDDEAGKTIAAASDLKITKGTKSERAKEVGETLATSAKSKKITKVVFDRNGYKFHGRIKALADGARASGLEF